MHCSRNCCASASVAKRFGNSAWNVLPLSSKKAMTRNADVISNLSISPLTLHDQADGDGLYTAGGKLQDAPFPEYRRQLETDESVEDAPCLLRVDQVAVDLARVGDRVGDRFLGDSWNTIRRVASSSSPSVSNKCQEMASPSRSSSVASHTVSTFFTMRRSSLITSTFSGLFFIDRIEILIDVHTHAALHEVAHMAVTRFHHEIFFRGILLWFSPLRATQRSQDFRHPVFSVGANKSIYF